MSYLDPIVLDRGLETLAQATTALYINSAEATDYGSAESTRLGRRFMPIIVGPQNALPSGRKLTVEAIADGEVTDPGRATHWSLVDQNNGRLLAAGPLANPLDVELGNAFTVSSFDIILPGLAAPG